VTLIRGLQERAARAFPAACAERLGEWWLRHSPGCAWWTGTVLPHGDGDLEYLVAGAERFYAARGLATRFQVTPGACPDGLDALLAGRGYRREGPTSLRTAAVADVLRAGAPTGVAVADQMDPEWFGTWYAVQGHGLDRRVQRGVLDRVGLPSGYASAVIGDDVVAVGRVVADGGWAGVFGMATLPEARGRGAARRVLAGLAGWAAARGIGRMYLQVESGNLAALRLYGQAGFSELCEYHYRCGTQWSPGQGTMERP
jgi:GNAT superfamily N-acetyltransferase